jgi:hypothetical protein
VLGLVLKDTVRLIDDLADSLVDPSDGAANKLDQSVASDMTVRITLRSNKSLSGFLHESWTVEAAKSLTGRVLDLQNVYKQWLVASASSRAEVIKVHNPEVSEDQLFISQVLPFGASASIYAFNRAARATRTNGVPLFMLVWSSYFDDYPHLPWVLAGETDTTAAEKLFELLGWAYSKKENRRQPCSQSFDVLGVSVDLSAAAVGML